MNPQGTPHMIEESQTYAHLNIQIIIILYWTYTIETFISQSIMSHCQLSC